MTTYFNIFFVICTFCFLHYNHSYSSGVNHQSNFHSSALETKTTKYLRIWLSSLEKSQHKDIWSRCVKTKLQLFENAPLLKCKASVYCETGDRKSLTCGEEMVFIHDRMKILFSTDTYHSKNLVSSVWFSWDANQLFDLNFCRAQQTKSNHNLETSWHMK